MTETTVGQSPRDLRIVTPAGWFDLELDPVLRKTRHKRMVKRRLGTEPETARLREELLAQLELVTERAVSQGAVFASMFSESMEGRVVGATLFAFLRPTALDTTTDDAEALSQAAEALTTSAPDAEVSVVELPAGPALRHRRRSRALVFDREVECDNVGFVIPVPHVASTLFLEFSTPTLPVADAMAQLFDAMAATLRWVW